MNSSEKIAESIAARAREITACMELYPRLPGARDYLIAGGDALIREILELYSMLEEKREAEEKT